MMAEMERLRFVEMEGVVGSAGNAVDPGFSQKASPQIFVCHCWILSFTAPTAICY